MAKISKQDAQTKDLVKIANERTGEILKVISPHDFIIGIDEYMESDLRVIGSTHITSSYTLRMARQGLLFYQAGKMRLEVAHRFKSSTMETAGSRSILWHRDLLLLRLKTLRF